MSDYAVLCADFRETLSRAEAMGGADLIATSPPYPEDARTCYPGLTWQDYQDLGDHVFRALKPGAHALINISAPVRQLREGHGTERDLTPYRLLLDWADRAGLTVPDTIAATRRGAPFAYRGRFRNDWEPVIWFRKPGDPAPIFRDRLKRPLAKTIKAGKIRNYRHPDGSITPARTAKDITHADIGNLWEYWAVGGSQVGDSQVEALAHPSRWPYRLAADIVACFSDVGDLVVDPFLGGATTLCAACDGERRFFGGDIEQKWVDESLSLARDRYAQQRLAL
ncbi:MAG: site-specific DNA-methyltransferase [bacterium]|nr:site-specific DNA-methyltransferase [bacterium]